jgi:sulfite reductase (NADPH) hemoprotein beta-component
MHLGGDRLGKRLNIKYKDSVNEEGILNELDNLFGSYSANKFSEETFGDFVIRQKLVTV